MATATRKPYDPGRLNRRVSLQSRSSGVDSIGQPLTTWAEFAQAWADIRFKSGMETIRSDKVSSEVQASIRLRYRTDVTAGHRIVYGGSVYLVDAVIPDVSGRQWLDLSCKVVS